MPLTPRSMHTETRERVPVNKRNSLERGGVPAVREDTEMVGFSDLADTPITRTRAIKLAGAAVTAGAFAIIWGADEADALTRAQRRRRRRRRRLRRRRRNVTTTNNTTDGTTVNFGGTQLGTPLTETVTIANNGPDTVTLRPEIAGGGFSLVDTDPITIAPGDTADLGVIFDPLGGGLSTGTLRLVDARDGVVLEDIDLLGRGLL